MSVIERVPARLEGLDQFDETTYVAVFILENEHSAVITFTAKTAVDLAVTIGLLRNALGWDIN